MDLRRRHRRGERSSSLQRRRQQRGDPARTGLGALVEQALGFARPVQGEWRAGAVTQQSARAARGQRPRSREAADRAAFATPRRNWLRVTNDNGLRADVILALDRLTHRYSPALRAEAGAAPASYPILCTNLAEEDRQTKEES